MLTALNIFRVADLQHVVTVLAMFEGAGVSDVQEIKQKINTHLMGKFAANSRPGEKIRPDNLTACVVCGETAITIPVNTNRGNKIGGNFTHVIQCQNRPVTDAAWGNEHCGHSEYVVLK